jgi:hypothetical protein
MLTPEVVELWSEDFIPSMTQTHRPTKDKIFTLKDLDIEATPIQKIAFNYLHRFRRDGGHSFLS